VEGEIRRGGLVGPVVLIGLGVVFLLDNLGLISLSVWEVLLRTWPVILIAWGVDLLIVRRTAEATLLTLALLVVILVGGVWVLGVRGIGQAAPRSEAIEQPLGSATRMEVELHPAVAVLRIDGEVDQEVMLSGIFGLSRGQELVREFSQQGSLARLMIGSGSGWFWPSPGFEDDRVGQNEWRVKLNPHTPLTLTIEGGVGRHVLHLTELDLEELNLDLGVGEVEIYLPQSGKFLMNLSTAIGFVNVIVPRELALRVSFDSALVYRDVEGFRREGELYLSPAAVGASDLAELHLQQAIGGIKLSVK
jgi:hypothetical protein